jgi:hypothetical protein
LLGIRRKVISAHKNREVRMFDEITRGRQYDGHHEAVIALLSDVKKALTMPDGHSVRGNAQNWIRLRSRFASTSSSWH